MAFPFSLLFVCPLIFCRRHQCGAVEREHKSTMPTQGACPPPREKCKRQTRVRSKSVKTPAQARPIVQGNVPWITTSTRGIGSWKSTCFPRRRLREPYPSCNWARSPRSSFRREGRLPQLWTRPSSALGPRTSLSLGKTSLIPRSSEPGSHARSRISQPGRDLSIPGRLSSVSPCTNDFLILPSSSLQDQKQLRIDSILVDFVIDDKIVRPSLVVRWQPAGRSTGSFRNSLDGPRLEHLRLRNIMFGNVLDIPSGSSSNPKSREEGHRDTSSVVK